MDDVRVLSFHASYKCHHAGACCSSDWPIPIESDRLRTLRAALASRAVSPAVADANPIVAIESADPTDPPALLGRVRQQCVFFNTADSPGTEGRCRIHSALGHQALPLACRQFPRVSVWDPRGASVTLSHYCPTAASLLGTADDGSRAHVMVNAPGFPPRAEYSGLDARATLPPLLRPHMLMDWDAWWACERLAVDALARARTAADGLAQLRAVVDDLECWSPDDGPLIDRVAASFGTRRRLHARVPEAALVAAVHRAIPSGLTASPALAEPRPSESARRRFLAAHAFANWSIHLRGLRAWLLSIEAASALIESGLGPRGADLLLRHLADTTELCEELTKTANS